MNNNDPITKADLQSLRDFIRRENRKLDNSMDEKIESVKKDVANLESKVDTLTDAVIEGFDNTERILSDWEGKSVNLISKQTKDKLQKPE